MRHFLIGFIIIVVAILAAANLGVIKLEIFSPKIFLAQVFPGPNEALFEFSPSSGTFYTNNTFSVDLKISSSVSVTSVKAYLNFNPANVQVTSLDLSNSIFGSQWEKTYNNTTGKIQIQASTPAPGKTAGLVANITFRSNSVGSVGLAYDAASLALTPADQNVLNLARSAGASFSITSPPAGSDTTAPVRANGQPTGMLMASTTQTNISLSTNENATCRYATVAGVAYNDMTKTFSSTGGTVHSTLIIGLTNGVAYNYYVRCRDAANPPNQNANDFTISFGVPLSPSAPLIPSTPQNSTLSVTLASNIASGVAPVTNISLTANVSGTTTGVINYIFYCNRADTGTGVTTGWAAKFDGVLGVSQTALNACSYTTAGTYTAKVIVERGSVSPVQAQTIITALPPPTQPISKLIGDLNKDGKVNVFDLSVLLSNWKITKAEYDLGGDNTINIFDLSVILSNWTK